MSSTVRHFVSTGPLGTERHGSILDEIGMVGVLNPDKRVRKPAQQGVFQQWGRSSHERLLGLLNAGECV